MFTLKSIEKYKTELYFSLIEQFNDIKEELSSSESITFKKYESIHSLAGMETWITSYRERIFFIEILKNLQKIDNDSDLLNFKYDLQFSIKENFREEDFRFHMLENSELNKKEIIYIVNLIIKNLSKIINSPNPFYLSQKKPFSFKTDGRPSKNGLSVKLIGTKTSVDIERKILEAEEGLKYSWEYGYSLYKLLTKKIISISSPDLVSYSYFTEPGISYINLKNRDLFDTTDDLIHENSHHHLNLLLKKYNLIKKNEYYLYSPWRRELRSSYAIFHSVFTFSYGALLFENILKKPGPYFARNIERAIFRLLEETTMIAYSLEDLISISGCFYGKGKVILKYLQIQNRRMLLNYKNYYSNIKSPTYKKRLSEIKKSLRIARKKYNLPRV